jgi:hypothetical protein
MFCPFFQSSLVGEVKTNFRDVMKDWADVRNACALETMQVSSIQGLSSVQTVSVLNCDLFIPGCVNSTPYNIWMTYIVPLFFSTC